MFYREPTPQKSILCAVRRRARSCGRFPAQPRPSRPSPSSPRSPRRCSRWPRSPRARRRRWTRRRRRSSSCEPRRRSARLPPHHRRRRPSQRYMSYHHLRNSAPRVRPPPDRLARAAAAGRRCPPRRSCRPLVLEPVPAVRGRCHPGLGARRRGDGLASDYITLTPATPNKVGWVWAGRAGGARLVGGAARDAHRRRGAARRRRRHGLLVRRRAARVRTPAPRVPSRELSPPACGPRSTGTRRSRGGRGRSTATTTLMKGWASSSTPSKTPRMGRPSRSWWR